MSMVLAPGALLMAKILEPETVSDEEADRLEKAGAAKLAAEEANRALYGALFAGWQEALKAAEQLEAQGLSTTVADLRFAKPLDEALIRRLLTTHEVAVTIEENAVGGFGEKVEGEFECVVHGCSPFLVVSGAPVSAGERSIG